MKKISYLLATFMLTPAYIYSMESNDEYLAVITNDNNMLEGQLNEDVVHKLNLSPDEKINIIENNQINLPLSKQQWLLIKPYFNIVSTYNQNPSPRYSTPAAFYLYNDFRNGTLNIHDLPIIKMIADNPLFNTTNFHNDIVRVEYIMQVEGLLIQELQQH